jgi:hypothetical protein
MTDDMATSSTGRNVIYTLKVETDPRAKAELQKFKQSVLDMFKELGAKQAERRDHAMRGGRGGSEIAHARCCCDHSHRPSDMHRRAEHEKDKHAAEAKRQAAEFVEGMKQSAESFRSLLHTMTEFGIVSKESEENFEKLWEAVEKGSGIVHNMTGLWEGASAAIKNYMALAAVGKGGFSGLMASGAFGPVVGTGAMAAPVALVATAVLSAAAGVHALGRFGNQVSRYGFMGGGATPGSLEDRYAMGFARVFNVAGINESNANSDRLSAGMAAGIQRQTGWGDYWTRQGQYQMEAAQRGAPGIMGPYDDISGQYKHYAEQAAKQQEEIARLRKENEDDRLDFIKNPRLSMTERETLMDGASARRYAQLHPDQRIELDKSYQREWGSSLDRYKIKFMAPGAYSPVHGPEKILNAEKLGVEYQRQALTATERMIGLKERQLGITKQIVEADRDAHLTAAERYKQAQTDLGRLHPGMQLAVMRAKEMLLAGQHVSLNLQPDAERFMSPEERKRYEEVLRGKVDPAAAAGLNAFVVEKAEAKEKFERHNGESVLTTAGKEALLGGVVGALNPLPLNVQEQGLDDLKAKQLGLQKGIHAGEEKVSDQQKAIAATIKALSELSRSLGAKPAPGENAGAAIGAANRAAAFGRIA